MVIRIPKPSGASEALGGQTIRVPRDSGQVRVDLADWFTNNIDLTPLGIINKFDLFNIQLTDTTNYGHFGKDNLPWEQTDLTDELKTL